VRDLHCLVCSEGSSSPPNNRMAWWASTWHRRDRNRTVRSILRVYRMSFGSVITTAFLSKTSQRIGSMLRAGRTIVRCHPRHAGQRAPALQSQAGIVCRHPIHVDCQRDQVPTGQRSSVRRWSPEVLISLTMAGLEAELPLRRAANPVGFAFQLVASPDSPASGSSFSNHAQWLFPYIFHLIAELGAATAKPFVTLRLIVIQR